MDLTGMLGRTFKTVTGAKGDDALVFVAEDGDEWRFAHAQDCCESVDIDDIVGDLADLVGSPLLQAEEVSSEGAPAPESAGSFTWTFYKFATMKGAVTVKWLGTSNGYYSESVSVYGPVKAAGTQ